MMPLLLLVLLEIVTSVLVMLLINGSLLVSSHHPLMIEKLLDFLGGLLMTLVYLIYSEVVPKLLPR